QRPSRTFFARFSTTNVRVFPGILPFARRGCIMLPTTRPRRTAMPVRNSAKALVLHEGKILVNRCTSRFGDYYALPGGGQREGETLLEAVRRELLEETGFRVV